MAITVGLSMEVAAKKWFVFYQAQSNNYLIYNINKS